MVGFFNNNAVVYIICYYYYIKQAKQSSKLGKVNEEKKSGMKEKRKDSKHLTKATSSAIRRVIHR
jgi:hypothetical protein